MNLDDDGKHIVLFCLIAFAATYALEACLWLLGGLSVWFATGVLVVVMFVPLVSAVMVVKLAERGSLRSYGIAKGKGRYYLYSPAYPFVVVAFGLLFVALLGTASIDFTMTRAREMFPQLFPTNQIPWYYIAINLATAPFINFLPALGEEYGWRGFLLPKLIAKYNLIIGLLLTGTIWGLWHAPVILMGYNYPHHPNLLGVTAFTVWCILAGFFLGWLRLKSESVFPAALGHGAIHRLRHVHRSCLG